MAIAIYLTLVRITVGTLFFFFSAYLTGAIAICLYVTAFALLYVVYNGQFRKMTAQRVLNIVMLQSFIICIWFIFVNLIQLYPYTVIKGDYFDWYFPQDFFPSIHGMRYIVAVFALLTIVCFITNWSYKHVKYRQQRHMSNSTV
jgi:NADH:ubiquinone oxidoreductase subunit 6 (subunit J)